MGTVQFDASIDLFGPACAGAVDRVRVAVQAIDGAGWISVEHCAWPTDGAGPAEVDAAKWLRVWARGNGRPVAGPEWDDLRDRVREAALAVIG